MRIDVFTIFPDMVEHFAGQSLLGKARTAGALDLRVHDLRSAAVDPHRSVDDAPFGGGAGVVLAPAPVFRALQKVRPPRPLLVPGVMGNEASADDESFSDGLLEYPHYTRPAEFRGSAVPEVLRSGDHGRIARWRRAQALRRTIERRPDLIAARGGIGPADRKLLAEFDLDDIPPPPPTDGS